MNTEQSIPSSCHVSLAADGDVAILIESAAFDETRFVEARLAGSRLQIAQDERLLLDTADLSQWSQDVIQKAPKLAVIAVTNPGGPEEAFAFTNNVRLMQG